MSRFFSSFLLVELTLALHAGATPEPDGVRQVDVFFGADACVKIVAAANDLPGTGGVVDARSLQGAQNCSVNPFTKSNVTYLLGVATFTVSSGVTFDFSGVNNASVVGSGPGRTVFSFSNTGPADGFRFSSTNLTLQGFSVNMNNTGTGHAFHMAPLTLSRLYSLEAYNAGGSGFFWDAGATTASSRITAQDINSRNNAGHGWWMKNTAFNVGNGVFAIIHLEANENTGDGIRAESFDGITRNGQMTFVNTRTENNGGSGVNCIGDGDQVYIKLEAEGNTGWGVNTNPVGVQKCDTLWFIDADFTGNIAGTFNRANAVNFYMSQTFTTPEWTGLRLLSDGTSSNPMLIRGAPAQTGDLLQFQTSNSTVQTKFDPNGFFVGGALEATARAGSSNQASLVLWRISGQSGPLLAWRDQFGNLIGQIANDGHLRIGSGIDNTAPGSGFSTGFQHKRVTSGSIAAGSSAAVTLSWTAPFADTNYTPVCQVQESTAGASTLRIHHIESIAASSVTVRIVNDDTTSAHTGQLVCLAAHD